MRSRAGALAWAEDAVRIRYHDFVETCGAQIKVLDDSSWAGDDVSSSKGIMMTSGRTFLSQGLKSFERKESEFTLSGLHVGRK